MSKERTEMRLRLFVSACLLFGAASALSGQSADPGMTGYLAQIRRLLPTPGETWFDPSDLSRISVGGVPQYARASIVAVEGQPFQRAVRAEVHMRGETPYSSQLQFPANARPIRKGDVIFFTFNIRCLHSRHESGEGVWAMYLQSNGPPWTTYYSTQGSAGRAWRRCYYYTVAERDFAPDEVGLTFHISQNAQTLEFGGMIVLNLGSLADASRLPVTRLTYPGSEPNAPWRRAAAQRIERYRKGSLSVQVTDRRGRPLSGARVSVRMKRHAYEFGSFAEQPILANTPDGAKYREWFLKLYNKATCPMYNADWGWESPQSRKDYLGIAEWLQKNRIPTKAHVLIYPGWQFMPTRWKSLEKDPPALRQAIYAHIREIMAATARFRFAGWDIINETRDLRDLPAVFGSDVIYADIFKQARAANAHSRFFINENTILTNGGQTELQQEIYERMIRYLLDQGAAVEAIGMQGHMGESLTPPERVVQILDRFARFKLPIQITEWDLPTRDEITQAAYTRDFMTAFFSHPATTGFTMWGFWEGHMWQPLGAMIRKDWSLKPNGRAYLDLVYREWWTNADGKTDRRGGYAVRGFLGDYAVTVTHRGKSRTVPVSLKRPGTRVTIAL